MTRIIDWAVAHTRMVLACIILSLAAGIFSYVNIPKVGTPDIEIPAFFVTVVYPGISAEDSERLLVRPLENAISEVEGLVDTSSVAAESYAGVLAQFDYGIDRSSVVAELRDKISQAEAELPSGANRPNLTEFSFSDFPILVVLISGEIPERTIVQLAEELQTEIESVSDVLEARLVGHRAEMLEVIIDPLQLEAYNVSANDLINIVARNNQLIAAGEISTGPGSFSLKVPSSFTNTQDVLQLPVKINGDRVVTLGDIAKIRMTFEDPTGYSRHNGESTISLQVIKRKEAHYVATADTVKMVVSELHTKWPEELRDAVKVDIVQDGSYWVESMVNQLESSVLTAIFLVMIVVLSALGIRSALLVGFAIPTSFMLCFAFLAVLGVAISNIVMFGLILAVGMLVDSAIVVVELADRKMKEGTQPLKAYAGAAKRMFWPIVSGTVTTLCAFFPMLFWPGTAGEFMGTLPVTLIFVLSASLLVALVFLPVVGGVTGNVGWRMRKVAISLRSLPWLVRLVLVIAAAALLYVALTVLINPAAISPGLAMAGFAAAVPGAILFAISAISLSVATAALKPLPRKKTAPRYKRRTTFGYLIAFLVGNPIMPVVFIGLTALFVGGTFQYYMQNNHGVDYFVDTEPDRIKIFVRARGNLGLEEADLLVREIEEYVIGFDGVASVLSISGALDRSFSNRPNDAVGEIQVEFQPWEDRQKIGGIAADTRDIVTALEEKYSDLAGIKVEIQLEAGGPQQGKPLNLRLQSEDWKAMLAAAELTSEKFRSTPGLIAVTDNRPLPGIDWQFDVDVEKAGRFGTDVATVGTIIQLITRGILLDTMRVDTSEEEIEIRVRFPEGDRLLSTLETLSLNTPFGHVPISNFVDWTPVPQLSEISRYNQVRYIDVSADVETGLMNESGQPLNANERIAVLTDWLDREAALPASVSWHWTGEREEQEEAQTFLINAFIGALGLMFAILLAQFNSFYNSILVLTAVILSTTGVLIGMLILEQPFSIVMTGTGVVALAGIVVNNNIVLIDTYQEFQRYMPRIEAIIRTVEIRIRPVLLTTVTTMAGLSPMMFGFSFDIINGGYTVDAPSAIWWKQLAAAVVFGLGIATALTLVLTPSLLALRVWVSKGYFGASRRTAALALGRQSQPASDLRLSRAAKKAKELTIYWGEKHFLPQATMPPSQSIEDQSSPSPEGDADDVAEVTSGATDTADSAPNSGPQEQSGGPGPINPAPAT